MISRQCLVYVCLFLFFFNHTAPPQPYTYGHTLSLHYALPIVPTFALLLARKFVAIVTEVVGTAKGIVSCDVGSREISSGGEPPWDFRNAVRYGRWKCRQPASVVRSSSSFLLGTTKRCSRCKLMLHQWVGRDRKSTRMKSS